MVTIGTTATAGTTRTWWSRSAPRPPKARREPGGHDRHHGHVEDLVVTLGTTATKGTTRTWWSRSAPRAPRAARRGPGDHDRHHGHVEDLVVTLGTTGTTGGTSRTWWSRSAPRPPRARLVCPPPGGSFPGAGNCGGPWLVGQNGRVWSKFGLHHPCPCPPRRRGARTRTLRVRRPLSLPAATPVSEVTKCYHRGPPVPARRDAGHSITNRYRVSAPCPAPPRRRPRADTGTGPIRWPPKSRRNPATYPLS